MVFRPQIKVIEEDTYAVEPAFDQNKITVIDPEEFSVTPNQNIQYTETLYLEDAAEAAPGGFEITGTITFPVRLSQMPFVNYIGLGQKYQTPIYASETDSSGNTVIVEYGTQFITLPSINSLPHFTVWANLIKPTRLETITGVVFNNYRLSLNSGQIVKSTLDFAGSKYKVLYGDDVDLSTYPQATTLPLDKTDVAAFQDAGIYADIVVMEVTQDSTTGNLILVAPDGTTYSSLDEVTAAGLEVIDVIYDSYDPNAASVPKYAIVGKKVLDVKTIDMTFNTTTFTRDAHRIGDRFAQEYPMTTIERRDFRCDITVDYRSSDQSFFKKFIAYLSSDNIVEPNQVDIGCMSLVVKIGSPTDVINKDESLKGPDVKSYDFGWIDQHLNPVGAFNRTVLIMPNVVLESVGTVTARPASIPELRVTARLLLDKGIFTDMTIQTFDGQTESSVTFGNEKLISFSFIKTQ